MLSLPDELLRHIQSFLIVCECCQKYTVATARTCVFCKRSWCVNCDTDRLIGYCYFEKCTSPRDTHGELMTCRWCLYEKRVPRYL